MQPYKPYTAGEEKEGCQKKKGQKRRGIQEDLDYHNKKLINYRAKGSRLNVVKKKKLE